jgi:hypothetical protein
MKEITCHLSDLLKRFAKFRSSGYSMLRRINDLIRSLNAIVSG